MRIGHPRRHFRVCDSTNERARRLAGGGAPGGTVITAGRQTAGRGREGRGWIGPPGKSLLYSAVLRPLEERHALLPLAVPLAVAETVEALGDRTAGVKWPNDVWIGERKCAGVLIEARPRDGWAVVGIGLNLSIDPEEFPPELRDVATSVGTEADAEQALSALNASLTRWVDAPVDRVLEEFRRRDALRGREIRWEEGSGTADGVDERGNLLVLAPSGERLSLGAGEVHLDLR